jgi:hypothetical protein
MYYFKKCCYSEEIFRALISKRVEMGRGGGNPHHNFHSVANCAKLHGQHDIYIREDTATPQDGLHTVPTLHQNAVSLRVVSIHVFLAAAAVEGEWPASCSGRFTPGEEPLVPAG